MRSVALSILVCALIFGHTALWAQDEKTVSSEVVAATVFFNGAELTHTAKATLVNGENTLAIEGLSPILDINTLKISTTNGVMVSSYEYSIDYLTAAKEVEPAVGLLRDSIEYYQKAIDKLNVDIRIYDDMLGYLQDGVTKNISGSENGLGIDDLVKTMDYYQTKSEEIETSRNNLKRTLKEYYETRARLNAQLAQESANGEKRSGLLRLSLAAPSAGATNLTIKYFTTAAGWEPYYDVNIASTDKPITLTMKSKVSQNTGLDWNKVSLTLSTTTPNTSRTVPLFSTWVLRDIPKIYGANGYVSQATNTVSYETADIAEALQGQVSGLAIQPQANSGTPSTITLHGMGSLSAENAPLYVIDGISTSSSILQRLSPDDIDNISVIKDASQTSIYGSRAANGVVIITTKDGVEIEEEIMHADFAAPEEQPSIADFVEISANELNATYEIDIPYTIPGTGKVLNIDLQSKNIPVEDVEYKYYSAPRLDTETYLLTEIKDWQELELLSAPANITYNSTYIGETFIDASSTQAKLTLMLGNDKRVPVERELMRDFSTSRNVSGNNIERTFTYRLTVKNNQTKDVMIVLKDQYPTSNDSKITVKLLDDTTPWTTRIENTGVITWEAKLTPGESRTYRICYSVKYPSDMRLNL